VIHIDRFGNLITNIASADLARLASFRHPTRFRRTGLSVTIAAVKIHGLASAYAAVPHGALLAIMGSWDVIEIAMRGGNAARRLAVARGAPVRITT
jgi:S-adenosylmethionine hydrolase